MRRACFFSRLSLGGRCTVARSSAGHLAAAIRRASDTSSNGRGQKNRRDVCLKGQARQCVTHALSRSGCSVEVPALRLDGFDVQVRNIDVACAQALGRELARIGAAAGVCRFVAASMRQREKPRRGCRRWPARPKDQRADARRGGPPRPLAGCGRARRSCWRSSRRGGISRTPAARPPGWRSRSRPRG